MGGAGWKVGAPGVEQLQDQGVSVPTGHRQQTQWGSVSASDTYFRVLLLSLSSRILSSSHCGSLNMLSSNKIGYFTTHWASTKVPFNDLRFGRDSKFGRERTYIS